MESFIQQEALRLYNLLLQSKALFQQMGQIEFVTQPKELIYRENKLTLYRFKPKVKKITAPPLLIVFALINRPDILDFSAEHSFIQGLLETGRDVYLLDWGYPTVEDRGLSLQHYLTVYLKNGVNQIQKIRRQKKVDLLGVCQGGVLSLCYACLFPDDVRRLVLISTPIDFQTPNDLLSKMVRAAPIQQLVEKQGNIPGPWLSRLFISLKPFHLLGKKYLTLLDYLSQEERDPAWLKRFFLVEKWLLDTPDHAGKAFLEFVKIFYQQNSLVRGKFKLADHCVDLQSLRAPVLNVIARDDHIVPLGSSRRLGKLIPPTAYRQKIFPAGHIGIYLSQKTSKRLPKMIASWLQQKEVNVNRRRQWTSSKKKKGKKKDRPGQTIISK